MYEVCSTASRRSESSERDLDVVVWTCGTDLVAPAQRTDDSLRAKTFMTVLAFSTFTNSLMGRWDTNFEFAIGRHPDGCLVEVESR